jgi:glycerol-1-phosphate dehydrogenase [NAD(P)+]
VTGRTALPDPTDLDGLRHLLAGDSNGVVRRPIGLRSIRIGPDALHDLADAVAAVKKPGPVVVIVDETAMTRDGADIKAIVAETLRGRFDMHVAVIRAHTMELHADEDALAQADAAIADAGCVVAVGSGTITDVAKDASHRAGGIPFVVVQTAVSVNAFSDDMAVLLRDGVKRTVPSRWPDALIVDIGILAEAPPAMNRAGFGELCSMFTAPADWYLADALGMGDGYDPGIVDLFRAGAEDLLRNAATLRSNDPAALTELAARMTLTGIAMGVAGRTAPLSGTEHLFSHLLDMEAGLANRPLAFHGAQVGVASVLAATIWHDTLEQLDPAALLQDRSYPEPSTVEHRVRAAFEPLDSTGRMADECWRDVARKLDRWHRARPTIELAAKDWDHHRSVLAGLVATPDRLRTALRDAGAAATVEELDPPAPHSVVRWAMRALPLMRDRFTVADLRFLVGLWEDDQADALLARSAISGGIA